MGSASRTHMRLTESACMPRRRVCEVVSPPRFPLDTLTPFPAWCRLLLVMWLWDLAQPYREACSYYIFFLAYKSSLLISPLSKRQAPFP